jgi:O-antigen ligase
LLFGAVVVASCAAQVPTILLRAASSDGGAGLIDMIVVHHFDRPVYSPAVWQTALLLEGIGLALLAGRTAAGHLAPLVSTFAAGAAGAAAMNVYRALEVALRQQDLTDGLLRSFLRLRISTQYSDVNAAGSFFAMAAVLAVAGAGTKTARERVCLLCVPLVSGGLWLSGSRVALAAAVLCTAVFAAQGMLRRGERVRRRWIPAIVAASVVLATVAAVFLYRNANHGSIAYSVFSRVELTKAGLRMAVARPLAGVGIARYYELFPRFASPELRRAFREELATPVTHENAHNNFVQILAELGGIGLGAFVIVLVLALHAGDRTSRWRAAAIAGAAAFLLTCLAGHPFLTSMVALPFWMLLGMAAADSPPLAALSARHLRLATLTTVVLLAVSLPVRWSYEREDADLEGVSVGLSAWQRTADGQRYRWAGARSAVFVRSTAKAVTVPLRSPDRRTRFVEIRLGGRPAAEVEVPPDMWVDMRLTLPWRSDAPQFLRIDLLVKGVSAADTEPALFIGRVRETGH